MAVSQDASDQACRLDGAREALENLRMLLELRLQQAVDESSTETLDNIISLVDSELLEYRRRRDELSRQQEG